MKTAQFKYSAINIRVFIDPRAFKYVFDSAESTQEEEEEFIRQVCQGAAEQLATYATLGNYYIKSAIPLPDSNTIRLLITDGTSVETQFDVTLDKTTKLSDFIIKDESKLPDHIGLNKTIMTHLNSCLETFDELARKNFVIRTRKSEEPRKPEVSITTESIQATFPDIDTSLTDMRQISEIKRGSAAELMISVEKVINNISAEAQEAANDPVLSAENKVRLRKFAAEKAAAETKALQDHLSLLAKRKEIIAAVPNKFASFLEQVSRKYANLTADLLLFKQILIRELFEAAREYLETEIKPRLKTMPRAQAEALLLGFNKQFNQFAFISDTHLFTNVSYAYKRLAHLSLNELQAYVNELITRSRNDQAAARILLSKIGKLNEKFLIFSTAYAIKNTLAKEMIKMTPAGSGNGPSFSFTENARRFEAAVLDVCRETTAQVYDRELKTLELMETDSLNKHTTAEIAAARKQAAKIKDEITLYKKFLIQEQQAAAMKAEAAAVHAAAEKLVQKAKQIEAEFKGKIDPERESGIARLVKEVEEKNAEAYRAVSAIREINISQFDHSAAATADALLHENNEKTLNSLRSAVAAMDKLNTEIIVLDDELRCHQFKLQLHVKANELKNEIAAKGIYTEQILTAHKQAVETIDIARDFKRQHGYYMNETQIRQLNTLQTNIDIGKDNVVSTIQETEGILARLIAELKNDSTLDPHHTQLISAQLNDVTHKLASAESAKRAFESNITALKNFNHDFINDNANTIRFCQMLMEFIQNIPYWKDKVILLGGEKTPDGNDRVPTGIAAMMKKIAVYDRDIKNHWSQNPETARRLLNELKEIAQRRINYPAEDSERVKRKLNFFHRKRRNPTEHFYQKIAAFNFDTIHFSDEVLTTHKTEFTNILNNLPEPAREHEPQPRSQKRKK